MIEVIAMLVYVGGAHGYYLHKKKFNLKVVLGMLTWPASLALLAGNAASQAEELERD